MRDTQSCISLNMIQSSIVLHKILEPYFCQFCDIKVVKSCLLIRDTQSFISLITDNIQPITMSVTCVYKINKSY